VETAESARHNVETFEALIGPGTSGRFLIDIRELRGLEAGALDIYGSSAVFGKVAFVTGGRVSRTLVTIFIAVARPGYLVQTFLDEQLALRWLEDEP
jgi:hypothetical protein